MITPTVGRVVHYYGCSGVSPLVALIAKVHDNRRVNLAVFDEKGKPYPEGLMSVRLIQSGDSQPQGSYCAWMPYQVKKDFGSESGEKQAGSQTI